MWRASRELHVEEKSPVQGLFNASATSDSSLDSDKLTGGLDEIKQIKQQLRDLPTRKDFLSLKKSLVGKSELKTVVTDIVKNLLTAFQEKIQNDFSERILSLKQDYEEKLNAMSIENESMAREIKVLKDDNSKLKTEINVIKENVLDATRSANFNEQYSRKNNVKVLNLPTKEKHDLRKDFIEILSKDLGLRLDPREVTEIHRIPTASQFSKDKPVIIRLASSEAKKVLMREKNLSGDIRLVDDITQKNLTLMKSLRENDEIESAWYYNTKVYGKSKDGLQVKFDVDDNIRQKLRECRESR
jgi:hypothetical protein